MSENIPMSARTPSEWKVDPSLQEAVDKYIKENPLKHKMGLEYNNFLLSGRFANSDTFKLEQADVEGEKILYDKILQDMEQYGLTEDDLEVYEKKILQKYSTTGRQS